MAIVEPKTEAAPQSELAGAATPTAAPPPGGGAGGTGMTHAYKSAGVTRKGARLVPKTSMAFRRKRLRATEPD